MTSFLQLEVCCDLILLCEYRAVSEVVCVYVAVGGSRWQDHQ